MQIDIRFELKPKQRPKLAEEIATALHTVPCYQKAPSLAYKIGDCTLKRDGTLRIPDSVDRETVSSLPGHTHPRPPPRERLAPDKHGHTHESHFRASRPLRHPDNGKYLRPCVCGNAGADFGGH